MTPRPPRIAPAPGGAAGFTLVELLVAATLALVVMAALASLFGIFGRAVADSQELVQVTTRMRSAAWRLRQDLQWVTTEVKPFIRPESAAGYLEIVEGPGADSGSSLVADVDDVLMLTTMSPGRPFTGLLSGTVGTIGFESPVAEVAWFCKQAPQTTDGLQLFSLYRRQLLVMAAPGAGAMATRNSTPFTSWNEFYLVNDLSARLEGSTLIANSLADLTRRPSRFMHNVAGAANPAVGATAPQISTSAGASNGDILTDVREGEDLVLGNVVSFDIRVFDPEQAASGESYVNLGSGGSTTLTGAGAANPFSGVRIYDTWSLHTEFNGVADSGGAVDRGTNLADDDGNGVVDDAAELEQQPPYSVPLRGLEIRIRCYEPSSQEVRQITIQHSFLAR